MIDFLDDFKDPSLAMFCTGFLGMSLNNILLLNSSYFLIWQMTVGNKGFFWS